jgi:hypothetical protein
MSGLPDDLRILGAELEAATRRAVRRRARRQAFATGAGTVLLALPLAVAFSAADLAPDGRQPRFSVATPSATVDHPPASRLLIHDAQTRARTAPCPHDTFCAVPSSRPHLAFAGRI